MHYSKMLLICIALWSVAKVQAQIEQDKVLHFVGGGLFGLAGAGIAKQASDGDRAWTFVGAVGGSLLVGVAKECIDQKQYGGWDNNDILATALGGVAVGLTLDLFAKRKKNRRLKRIVYQEYVQPPKVVFLYTELVNTY